MALVRRLTFIVLLSIVIFVVVSDKVRMFEDSGPQSRPTAHQSVIALDLLAKTFFIVEALSTIQRTSTNDQLRVELEAELTRVAGQSVDGSVLGHRPGIIFGGFGDEQLAEQHLQDLACTIRQTDGVRADHIEWLATHVYGDNVVSSNLATELHSVLRVLDFGWYEHLVWEQFYRKVGDEGAISNERQRLVRESLPVVIGLALLVIGLLASGLTGVVLLTVFVICLARGRWKSRPFINEQIRAGALWETFVLYLFIFTVFGHELAVGFARLTGVSESPGLGAEVGLQLIIGVLSLTSLLWLAPFLRFDGRRWGSIGMRSNGIVSDTLWGIGSYMTTLPLIVGVVLFTSLMMQFLPEFPETGHPAVGWVTDANGWALVGIFVLACVAAPVIEEIFFRGVLFTGIRQRWGSLPAIVLSSIIFAILHPQVPLGFLPLTMLGIVFAVLREVRGSIVPGMVAHGVNNLVAMLAITLMTR